MCSSFFFFNDTATTEIYTLSLHDALPILVLASMQNLQQAYNHLQPCSHSVFLLKPAKSPNHCLRLYPRDRKSTRLNSSHANISYAVFCLKKKNNMISVFRPCQCISAQHTT